jgi:hypothetical protein
MAGFHHQYGPFLTEEDEGTSAVGAGSSWPFHGALFLTLGCTI